jgi:signal peptidase
MRRSVEAGSMSDGDRSGPAAEDPDAPSPDPRDGVVPALRWLRHSDEEWVVFGRELVKSAAVVALVGLVLFGVSGVWPPMVAVESGSMEPHMFRGDLVFLLEEHRFASGAAVQGTGITPYQQAVDTGYRKFGSYGDVVVYKPPGRGGSPIIHRARFWVSAGENWVSQANPDHLPTTSCEALANCPAPHAGFITKGDANAYYDQAQGLSPPVRPEWIRGRAALRVPWLGYVRLVVSSTVASVGAAAAAV